MAEKHKRDRYGQLLDAVKMDLLKEADRRAYERDARMAQDGPVR